MANASIEPFAIASRTDGASSPVDDVKGETLRLVTRILEEGVVDPATAFQVTQDTGSNMNIKVGSGTAKADLYKVDGGASGQEGYLCRLESQATIAISAADPSNPRIDEVYLVIFDDAYDSGGEGYADVVVRTGTPAASPSAPGPAGSWDAYAKLATISVAAAATAITNANITDGRVFASVNDIISHVATVTGYAEVSVAGPYAPGSGEQTVGQASVTIPSTWRGWDITVQASGLLQPADFNDSIATVDVFTELSGTERQRLRVSMDATNEWPDAFGYVSRYQGTATGSQTVSLKVEVAAGTGDASILDANLLVVAHRTA